ncbi:Irregular chiasm C-roughest protein [Blattella germanica]|nr:Irregular chiasm C-roughest protein [Blattella germanica]
MFSRSGHPPVSGRHIFLPSFSRPMIPKETSPPVVPYLEVVVGTSANLTLDVDADTAGRYYCKASVMGFPEIGAEAAIYLKGPPTIISHRTQFGIQGDNVRLECVAFSIPKPEHVMWTYKGNEVDADDKDYTILEDPLPEGIKSTLVIRESQEQHFGAYNCSVTNPYGSDLQPINLAQVMGISYQPHSSICLPPPRPLEDLQMGLQENNKQVPTDREDRI